MEVMNISKCEGGVIPAEAVLRDINAVIATAYIEIMMRKINCAPISFDSLNLINVYMGRKTLTNITDPVNINIFDPCQLKNLNILESSKINSASAPITYTIFSFTLLASLNFAYKRKGRKIPKINIHPINKSK